MKILNIFLITSTAALLAGCASPPRQKPVHVLGWIGGSYDCAKNHLTFHERYFGAGHTIECFPKSLQPARTAAVFVRSLETQTPAYQAGVRAGDLILEVAHQPATNLPCFWQAVDTSTPGASLPVKIFRNGQTHKYDVTVGREKYQEQGMVVIALPGFWQAPHLFPRRNAPKFSLIALGWEGATGRPTELDTVEQRYRQSCNPKYQPVGYDQEWKFWLAIVEVSKSHKIIGQELVSPPAH